MQSTAETSDINAARTFLTDLGAHVTGTLLVKLGTARSVLAGRHADTTTLAVLARLQEHGTVMAGLCTQATEHLDTYHAAMEQAVTTTPDAADTDFYRPDTAVPPAGTSRTPAGGGGASSGRAPQQPDAAGVVWIDPHDGTEARGRIIKRTKSTADIEWPNGRVEKGVKLTEPGKSGTLRWLTQEQLDAEEACRWPTTVRGVDGLVAIKADDCVLITAGTAQQLAGIDPMAWQDRNGKERYAAFEAEELPQLNRALAAAARAATRGKTYRKTIHGSDIGDVELAVAPQPDGDPAVTFTVRPYEDVGDEEDLDEVKESDFGDVPDDVEDDDTGLLRPITAEERADIEALNRADYDTYMREHPKPQPLVVTLTVPMIDRLRDRLAAGASAPDTPGLNDGDA